MALSKETFRPIFPKDMHNNVRVGRAAADSDFVAGTLVVRVNDLYVACDTDTAVHKTLPVEIIWEDGTTRVDLDRYELDGTAVQEYTTLVGNVVAEVATSRFTATPVAGDVIAKSATAGSFDPLDTTELASLDTADGSQLANLQLIGRVVGAGRSSGFWLCHFELG